MLRQALAWWFAIFCSTASANPITYTIDYFVDEVTEVGSCCGGQVSDVAVGNRYFGLFVVDDSLLALDGPNQPAQVYSFYTRFGDVVWISNLPYPISEFAGFRGPPSGSFSSSPGFDVVGGKITGIRGGVFGTGDAPYIDFVIDRFFAFTFGGGYAQTGIPVGTMANGSGRFSGTLAVHQVPEPAPLSLLVGGLLFLVWQNRARSGKRSQ